MITVLFAFQLNAQEKYDVNQRSILSFNAGVSIPIMCFASENIHDRDAGFAKPGFTLDITYGYRFGQNLGVVGSVFFAGNKTNNNFVQSEGNRGFRYYGIVVGPMASKNFSDRWTGDLRFMAGITKTHSPRLSSGDATILNSDESYSFAWSAGTGLRYHLSEKTFLSIRADHTQMKPKLNSEGAFKSEQHIVVINVGAGMGIKW